MKNKMPHDYMLSLAIPIVELLRPYCERIEISGSLRRKRAEVGDIEIVAVPREWVKDLLGFPTDTHSLDTFDFDRLGRVVLGGHKYKKIILPGEVQLDLFIVTPPAQWGVTMLLRTGSAGFSKRFVTQKSFGGYMPAGYQIKDGALWTRTSIIETPEEKDVFSVLGIKYIPPTEREV